MIDVQEPSISEGCSTLYDPERDGIRCRSPGVFEHWNNAADKKYSRNLGRASGIELFQVS